MYNYYTKACQAISKYESELPESTPYLKSVRIYLEALCEMLLDHDIEDLEWSGSFVPSFDWITLQNHQVDAIFCNVFDDCEKLWEVYIERAVQRPNSWLPHLMTHASPQPKERARAPAIRGLAPRARPRRPGSRPLKVRAG